MNTNFGKLQPIQENVKFQISHDLRGEGHIMHRIDRRRPRNAAVWISIMPKSKKYGASMSRVLVLRWIGAKQKTAGSSVGSLAGHDVSKSNVIYLNWKTISRIPKV